MQKTDIMKRVVFLFTILFCTTFICSAQTYCFKAIESVQNGVKSKIYGGRYQYFTFQNGMNRFYISDANGYAGSVPLIFNLISTPNGRYKFQQQGPMGPIGNFYIFNSDFTRANSISNFLPGSVIVFKRVDGDEEEEFY